MAAVVGGVDQGWINPIVGKEYPLEKAPEAHLDIIEGKAKGKMVLNVS
jgi:NADPH2:quinone reductase